MKKLLGILGTITIAGSGMAGLVGNAPTPEKNEINYLQTNDSEKLNRNKRWFWSSNKNFNLNVPRFVQSGPYWCGPAVGEMVLRYFGFNIESGTGRGHRNFQESLAYAMYSNPQNLRQGQRICSIRGTEIINLVNAINNIIRDNNLNNNRQYSIQNISNNYNNQNILNNISNSLENNTPVILAYHGILPSRFNLHNNNIEDHFIVINGVNTSSQMITYTDPGTGESGEFSIDAFWLLVSLTNSPSFLISYNPNSQSETQIPRPNQTEPMETDNNFIFKTGIDFCLNARSKRETVEIWAVPFKGHKIKLSLNYEKWKNILLISSYKNKQNFKDQAICIFLNCKYKWDSFLK